MTRKYAKIRSEFEKIIKILKKNDLDFKVVVDLKREVWDTFDRLKKEVERTHHDNKKSVPKEERFLEIIPTDGSMCKLTYRPENGQCLVKLQRNTPTHKILAAQELAEHVIDNFPDDVKLTLRGTLLWSDTKQGYRVTLADNNRSQYKLKFEL